MKRRTVFINSIMVALATSVVAFTTVADAAVVRHHFVHHTAAHLDRAHRHVARGSEHGHRGGQVGGSWVRGSWIGDDQAASEGWVNSYYDSHGVYGRSGDDYCGPIQWTRDSCNFYGP